MLTLTLGVANMVRFFCTSAYLRIRVTHTCRNCSVSRAVYPPIKPAGRIINWSVFRNSTFFVYCAAQFMVSLGSYIGASRSSPQLMIQPRTDLYCKISSPHLHQQQCRLSRNLGQLCVLPCSNHQREYERASCSVRLTGRSFRCVSPQPGVWRAFKLG
jgi:hypothetical protein